MIEPIKTTIADISVTLKQRYVTVFLDLPQESPIEAVHKMALQEVKENVAQILRGL